MSCASLPGFQTDNDGSGCGIFGNRAESACICDRGADGTTPHQRSCAICPLPVLGVFLSQKLPQLAPIRAFSVIFNCYVRKNRYICEPKIYAKIIYKL